jgi:secondary thiamine-phosphate synthase enzyme
MQETTFRVRTSEREQILIVTREVNAALATLVGQGAPRDGICTIVVPHTTCAISVNENADPDVPTDLVKALRAMIPNVKFQHGEGNSAAHLLSMMIGASLQWPYRNGELALGTWQGIYFIELDGPRERKVVVYG